jgi:RNA polymerase sigma-70 factor, ECF subfamily
LEHSNRYVDRGPTVTATMDLDREQAWVEEARRDPRAFERLYNHYFPRVYAYVCYRVGRAHDGEDLVADTFLKAVEGLGRFEWRHEGSFAAWLFRIAHNAVADHHRRAGRQESPIPLEDLPDVRAGDLLPEDDLLKKEKLAHLRSLLATLSPRRQEIITLKFFGGLRNSEIAAVLGLDERTVASHLCRGLRDLHQKLLDEPGSSVENRQ